MSEGSWDFRADYELVRAARRARIFAPPRRQGDPDHPVDFSAQVMGDLARLRSGRAGTRLDARGRAVPPSGS